jgi:putative phosphoesterase
MSEDVCLIIHLGDDYEDTEVFGEFDIDSVIRVPGVYDAEYSDRTIPHRSIEDISGWRVMVSHTPVSHSNDFPEDLKPEEVCARREIDVLLHGHTHTPDVSVREGILHFNPGHLKPEDKKGHPPSFGVLEFTPERVEAKILGLTGREEIISTRMQKRNG